MSPPSFSLNHVIIYVHDAARSLKFYRDTLGFRVIESMPGYARLRSRSGGATIALHVMKGRPPSARARPVVLYFETRNLFSVCTELRKKGVRFDQPPERMPWGWDHAYLRDPDGHPISLYWAGRKRFQKSPPMPDR
jgi:catechol 2,3-dioxygenase-like lactoylglutathione lyase family enzyme